MARKLKGRIAAKGLKGALARHEFKEKTKEVQVQKASAQKQNQEQKINSIKGTKKAPKQKQQTKGLVPFGPDDKVMLVGEGDFTFALSIVQQGLVKVENLIATSYDGYEEVVAKYPKSEETLQFLKDSEVTVIHDVDAMDLLTSLKLRGKNKNPGVVKNIDAVMFNFPHTGRGMKDVDRNIRDHQKLVLHYIKSCKELFAVANSDKKDELSAYTDDAKTSKIILSVFEGEPYQSWGIKILARSEGYKVERSGKFDWAMFPEYHHKRTNGVRDTTKPAAERDARIYVFEENTVAKKKAEENDLD